MVILTTYIFLTLKDSLTHRWAHRLRVCYEQTERFFYCPRQKAKADVFFFFVRQADYVYKSKSFHINYRQIMSNFGWVSENSSPALPKHMSRKFNQLSISLKHLLEWNRMLFNIPGYHEEYFSGPRKIYRSSLVIWRWWE